MKKIAVIILCLAGTIFGNAQLNKGKYAGNDGATKNLEFYDDDGNLIPIGYHPNIEGSPMLYPKTGIGSVKFQNNLNLVDSSLNYSLADDKLYYIRDNKYYSFKQPVKEFSIQYLEEPNKIVIFHFKAGFPEIENHTRASLYELIYEGTQFMLLKWQHKKVEEHTNYGSATDKEFVTVYTYYLYFPGKEKMEKLGLKFSLNDLKKFLPDYATKLDAYASQHKINLKNESEMQLLFQYLESN
jgi:hypothetical protein